MENFTINIPTVLYFGRDVVTLKLNNIVKKYGSKALLVYGKGSIKRNGVYDIVTQQLNLAGIEYIEYSGIKSNPVYEDVDAAAKMAREGNIDFIVAVGGGSVIDSAKMISVTIPVTHSVWDFFDRKAKPREAVPLISILTVAATGTEMNSFAVLQNNKTLQKDGYSHPLLYPKYSFLDPQFTYSVPAKQTAYGIVDLIAHCLENYFGAGDAYLSEKIAIATISEAIDSGKELLNNLNDYNLRARIMYAATVALNGWNSFGKANADWGVHGIGHVLSLLYDIPHGASLSIAYPAWLKHHINKASDKIELLGNKLFGATSAETTINKLEDYFTSIGSPVTLKQAGITENQYDKIADTLLINKVSGSNYELSESDIRNIFNLMI